MTHILKRVFLIYVAASVAIIEPAGLALAQNVDPPEQASGRRENLQSENLPEKQPDTQPAPAPSSTPSGKADLSGPRQGPLAPGEQVNIDINDADIKLVVKFISDITGKNFVLDDKVKGKVTIISPQPVTAEEAMKVFESVMSVYGYTLVQAGGVIKIIPAAEARQHGEFTGKPKEGDRMVTRLIPLNFVKADDLVNILRPLIPPYSYITAFGATNTLLIVDYASNVDKLSGIITQLDTASHEEIITVQQLKYAGAKELATKLEQIYKPKTGKSSPPQQAQVQPAQGAPQQPQSPAGQQQGWTGSEPLIIADERINAIVVVANKPATTQILALIERLDIKPATGRGGINVYYLKNANAEDLAKVLNNFTQSQVTTGQAAAGQQAKAGAPSQAIKLQDKVTITPDKATNSLLITASVEDYETLKDVIERLDIRRRQVFVEALIMEVSSDNSHKFGVEWRTTSNFTEGGVQGIGGTNLGNINSTAANPFNTSAEGLAIGVVDGVIEFNGTKYANIGALVTAMQKEQGINILSTPNIMTTDNAEAEIVVGQNVPFLSSQSQTQGGVLLNAIERKDIGIKLKLTPQISESDDVKLAVYQEISALNKDTQLDKAQDLITLTRSVKTTVVVRDAQNIVLGGLIREDFQDTTTKVPLLGDIPILGWLFKFRGREKVKTNLLIFLTPHIIRSSEDVDKITGQQRSRIKINTRETDEFSSPVKEAATPIISQPEQQPEGTENAKPESPKTKDVKENTSRLREDDDN